MSPAVAAGRRVPVPGRLPLSIWLPDDWEVSDDDTLFNLLALGPSEDAYRANLSITLLTLEGDPSLESIANAAATLQQRNLDTFLEYDRRPAVLAGRQAIQREYAWVQGGTGLVLYQLEVLAKTDVLASTKSPGSVAGLAQSPASSATNSASVPSCPATDPLARSVAESAATPGGSAHSLAGPARSADNSEAAPDSSRTSLDTSTTLSAASIANAAPRLIEVHATSAAPAYFRYAAVLRRMLESIEPG